MLKRSSFDKLICDVSTDRQLKSFFSISYPAQNRPGIDSCRTMRTTAIRSHVQALTKSYRTALLLLSVVGRFSSHAKIKKSYVEHVENDINRRRREELHLHRCSQRKDGLKPEPGPAHRARLQRPAEAFFFFFSESSKNMFYCAKERRTERAEAYSS